MENEHEPSGDGGTARMVTLNTIAEEARLSVSTVSRVLNRVPNAASAATTARVLSIAESLGYVPNAQAAALRTGTSMAVGLIIADISNPFFAEIAVALEQRLLQRGIGLLVANTGNNPDLERQYVRLMAQNRVQALIVAPTSNEGEHLKEAQRFGIQVVLIDTPIEGLDVDSVLVDDEQAIEGAVAHLIGLGHERIGYISGHQRILSDVERLKGWSTALEKAGLEVDRELVVSGEFTELGGLRAASRLLALPEPPTAIVAGNNFMAIGAIRSARARGVRIPDDLSLVSFDDMDWFDLADPMITAIRQPVEEIGTLVSDLVLAGKKSSRGVNYVLKTSIIVRESSAPPKARKA